MKDIRYAKQLLSEEEYVYYTGIKY